MHRLLGRRCHGACDFCPGPSRAQGEFAPLDLILGRHLIPTQLGEPFQLIGQIDNLSLFDGNLRPERPCLRLQHPNTGSNLAHVQLEEWRPLFD